MEFVNCQRAHFKTLHRPKPTPLASLARAIVSAYIASLHSCATETAEKRDATTPRRHVQDDVEEGGRRGRRWQQ